MSSQGSDAPPHSPRPFPRSFWFASVFLLFLVCSWIAFRQEPHPDAYWKSTPLHADWWLHPIEVNAASRLPRVWADLNDVFALKRTKHVWVVGGGGLVLHSSDYGRHWMRQYLVAPNVAGGGDDHNAAAQEQATQGSVNDKSQSSPPNQLVPPNSGVSPENVTPAGVNSANVNPENVQSQAPTKNARQQTSNRPSQSAGTNQVPSVVTADPVPSKPELTLRELTNSDLYSVYFVDDQYGWIAGNSGTLFNTRDGGRTWTQNSGRIWGLGMDRSAYRMVFFLDRLKGWVTGEHNKSLITQDGGSNWYIGRIHSESERFPGVTCIGPMKNPWDALACTDGLDFAIRSRIGISLLDPKPVGSIGSLSSELGLTVRTFADGMDPRVRGSRVYFLDQETGWAAYGPFLLTTTNGGQTWRSTELPTFPSVVSFSDRQHGWIVGTQGTLLATSDGGTGWQRQTQEHPPSKVGPAQSQGPIPLLHHRIFPAPWYYLSLCLVGLLFIPALKRPQPRVISESAEDLLVSDQPIGAPGSDKFDFTAVALGLSRFLRNEKTLPPLTIAVTGEWGTGKSSLMNLLRVDLKRYGFRPVWFNAWHHQKEENLLASLLETIRAQAIPPSWRPEGAIFRLRLLGIRWARFWPVITAILIVFSFSLGYLWSHPQQLSRALEMTQKIAASPTQWLSEAVGSAGGPWLPFLLSSTALLYSLWKGMKGFGVNPASLLARDAPRTRLRDLEELTGFRHRFAAEFQDITRALNPRTLLILIDDLDRCRPEMVLEVLEAVNFLISSGDCFVVLGMARERVVRCVGLSFKDVASELLVTEARPDEANLTPEELARKRRLDFAQQYLEKLINIEVPVPAPTDAQARRLFQKSAAEEERPEELRRRWRQAWFLAKKALPATTAAGLLILSFWFGSSRPIRQAIDNPATGAPTVQRPAGPAALIADPTAHGGVRAERPSQGPARMEEGEEASFPLFFLLVVTTVLVGLGIWRLSIPPGVVIRDSPEFEKALETWHPLVFASRKTPRSIKRFLNRVRYLAMLQRGQSPESSRWRQLLIWLRHPLRGGADSETNGGKAPAIPEGALVALAAIEYCRLDWLQQAAFFKDVRTFLASRSVPKEIEEALVRTPLASYRDTYARMSEGIHVS